MGFRVQTLSVRSAAKTNQIHLGDVVVPGVLLVSLVGNAALLHSDGLGSLSWKGVASTSAAVTMVVIFALRAESRFLLATVLFTLLAAYNVAGIVLGSTESSCSCFGTLVADPRVVVAADISLAAASAMTHRNIRGSKVAPLRQAVVPTYVVAISLLSTAFIVRPERVDANRASPFESTVRTEGLPGGAFDASLTVCWFYNRACPVCTEALPEFRSAAQILAAQCGQLQLRLIPLHDHPTAEEVEESGFTSDQLERFRSSSDSAGSTPFAIIFNRSGEVLARVNPPNSTDSGDMLRIVADYNLE